MEFVTLKDWPPPQVIWGLCFHWLLSLVHSFHCLFHRLLEGPNSAPEVTATQASFFLWPCHSENASQGWRQSPIHCVMFGSTPLPSITFCYSLQHVLKIMVCFQCSSFLDSKFISPNMQSSCSCSWMLTVNYGSTIL